MGAVRTVAAMLRFLALGLAVVLGHHGLDQLAVLLLIAVDTTAGRAVLRDVSDPLLLYDVLAVSCKRMSVSGHGCPTRG
jgi:hypothetical protein